MATESYSTDPAVIEQVLAMQPNDEDPQAIQLAQRQAMINKMRGNAMAAPGQRGQMAGRVFVGGNNAATVLGDVAQGIAAGKMQSDVDAGQQSLGQSRTQGKQAYMKAMLGAMRGGQAPSLATQTPDGFQTNPQAGY